MTIAEPSVATRVNNFAIKLANVNGTGSSSANNLLMRSIFRMGIPVSGKNLFPSNIQGLPTWYEIRVNASGWTARTQNFDVIVAMDLQTYAKDIAEVTSGGYVIYDSTWPLDDALRRDDVTFLGIPLSKLVNEHFTTSRERMLMKNIVTAGALVGLLNIDKDVVAELLVQQYKGKEKLRDSNQLALRLGYEYVEGNLDHPLPCRLQPMERTGDWIITDGNTAAALGCIYAGATVAAWYPITPSTSLMDAFTSLCAKYRRDPVTGENNYIVIQAEDELASIGMVVGASWNGARAFTSTAGPGISLMNEMIGLAYYTETPAVVFDIQRVGPSTGMPTRTQQGDILECAYASHGDTKQLCLFPANPTEAFEMAVEAFDLADHFQTPVIVLSDLDIGMNDWVIPALTWDDGYRPDLGRVLTDTELQTVREFHRFDPEGDPESVAARTIPGHTERGAYFARGSGHSATGRYTEDSQEYREVIDRVLLKHKAAAAKMPKPWVDTSRGGTIGMVTVGGCDLAVREACELLSEEGIATDILRVRGFPFGEEVHEFLAAHEVLFVIEQNRDAQLRSLLTIETPVDKAKLRSILSYAGQPLSASEVVEGIKQQVGH